VLLAYVLSKEDLFEWGWRIPFLIGILIAPVGIYIRRQLPETIHDSEKHESALAVLRHLTKHHSREVILGVLAICGGTISTYALLYMTTYAITTLNLDPQIATTLTFAGAIISIPAIFIGAWIADRFGRKPIVIISRLVFMAAIVPAYLLIAAKGADAATIIGANLVLNFLFSLATGGFYALLTESLPKSVRSSGLSILYALSVTIFGGSAQFVMQSMINWTGDPLMPAWYQIAANLVSVTAILLITAHPTEREALKSIKRK
jgi:MFS family permease